MKNIFVSSTFRDMQAERDMIQKEVLPQLRNRARVYGENINVIDLRWGVDTSELESEEGSMKVMSVCLDEVERSNPYMLIFLGERYGSIIEPRITEKVIAHKNCDFKLENYEISITAMEVEFGALAQQYGNPEKCIVCMRRFAPESMKDAADKAVYSAENPTLAKKQSEFKEKIAQKLKGRIFEYTCEWDEVQKQLVNFKTIDGEVLSDVLVRTYEDMFRTEWEAFAGLAWEEKAQLAAGAAIESKLKSFKGRERLLLDYYEKALHAGTPLILQGAVGSGKTSIMCKLIEMLETSGKHVFRFMTGCSSMSESAVQMVQQMVYYLEKLLGMEHGECVPQDDENHERKGTKQLSYRELLEYLKVLAGKIKEEEKVYFMIDAVDQMYKDEHVKQLDFVLMESGMQYVLSCTDEFEIPKFRMCTKFQVEQVPLLEVQDAKEVVEGLLIAGHRNVYKDILAEILNKKSANNPLYISMLIQRLNMMGFEELYSAWSENDIIRLGCQVIRDMPDGAKVAAVFLLEEAIERLTGTADTSEVLGNVINMIGVSRNGLREADILAITEAMGSPVSQLDLSRLIHYLDTFFVIHQDGRIDFTHKIIRKGIRENTDNRKYIEAIAARIRTLNAEDELWKSEGMYYARMTKDVKFAEVILHIGHVSKDKVILDAVKEEALADGGEFYYRNMSRMPKAMKFFCFTWNELFDITKEAFCVREKICRKTTELYEEYYQEEGKTDYLRDLVCSYDNLGNLLLEQDKTEEALCYYEKVLDGFQKVYQQTKSMESFKELSYGYERMGNVLLRQGKAREAQKYYQNYKDISEIIHKKAGNLQSLRELAISCDKLGRVLEEQGKLESALEYLQKSLEGVRLIYAKDSSTKRQRELAVAYNNVGSVLHKQGKYEQALEYYLKGLEGFEEVYKKTGTQKSLAEFGDSYLSIGLIMEERNDLEQALEYYLKVLEVRTQVYEKSGTINSLSDLSIIYGYVGDVYKEQGMPETAQMYFQKALESAEIVYKSSQTLRNLRELAVCYAHMGSVLRALKKAEEAVGFYRKYVEITQKLHQQVGTLNSLSDLSVSYNNMANMLRELGDYQEALEYYQKALEGIEKIHKKTGTQQSLKHVAMACRNVAAAFASMGKEDESQRYREKAQKVAEALNNF